MAEKAEPHTFCPMPSPFGQAYRNIVGCPECGRFWILKDGWHGRSWRPVGRFLAWRLRRQISLEGSER